MSLSWRPLHSDEIFVYDFSEAPRDSYGYCFATVPRGHAYCKCLLSKTTYWYRKHDPATGPWPNYYTVTDEYVERLLFEHRDIVREGWTSASYGYIRRVRRQGSGPY
jgi:hypothetical protein